MNNKYFQAVTIASCTLFGMYGYSRNEAAAIKPLANYSLDFTKDNAFSSFIV